MTIVQPLFATDRTAARLLDMTRPQFLDLVKAGALPGPCALNRWDVAELQAIMRGPPRPKNEDIDL